MKRFILFLLLTSPINCLSQTSTDETLKSRIEQIKKLDLFDSKIIFAIDSFDYNDLSFPYWNPDETYYQGDFARYKYILYEAKLDNKGVKPTDSEIYWIKSSGPHPSLYLRDSANIEDLRILLAHENSFIKLYAFGSLSYRNESGLYKFILNEIDNYRKILSAAGDEVSDTYIPELMIKFYYKKMSSAEIRNLTKLIKEKYHHLIPVLAIIKEN
ncbi:MAG: hypothetical protein ACK5WV_13320 [Chryseotalea sp.]